jgi:signal transduction histidine kinase
VQSFSVFEAVEIFSEDQCFQILSNSKNNPELNQAFSDALTVANAYLPRQSIRTSEEIFKFVKVPINVDDVVCNLVILQNLTSLVRLKQFEFESQLSSILTATASHEMKTPLNSILSLMPQLR